LNRAHRPVTSPGLCIGCEHVPVVLLVTDMILQVEMMLPVPHAETTLACKEVRSHRITKSALLPLAGASLHMCMTPHGPDAATFERAVASDGGAPEHLPRDTLAFMFEARPGPLYFHTLFPECVACRALTMILTVKNKRMILTVKNKRIFMTLPGRVMSAS